MLYRLRNFLFRKEIEAIKARERGVELLVNQRVASVLTHMDPFEPLFRKYTLVFSEDFTRPEDGLNSKDELLMLSWAYTQKDDVSFKRFMAWILNSHGNDAIKKGNPTPETILYSRALMAAPILIEREVVRMSAAYEKMRDGQGDFDPHAPLEE